MLVNNYEAKYWYEKGCSIELNHFELFDNDLNDYIQKLKKSLALSKGCVGNQ